MAWTHTYDVNTPTGSDDPKEGDDRIREVKAALQERLALDHYFPKTGSEVSNTAAGEHKKVTLRVGDAPTEATDKIFIYAKDVSAKAELFCIDEDGDEVQLTSGGKVLGRPKIHTATGTDNIDMSSSSYADMTDMSITATFKAGKVFITFNTAVQIQSDAGVPAYFAILVDGSLKNTTVATRGEGTSNRMSVTVNLVETLTAGEHTIKVQWKVGSGTVKNWAASDSSDRTLTIFECL